MILARRFTVIVERSWKNMYFNPKMAWSLATYDDISRNRRNWPLLNLSQKVRHGWTNSYWKRQVLMFYPLGKKLRKTLRGWWHPPPPPLPRTSVVRPVRSILLKNYTEAVFNEGAALRNCFGFVDGTGRPIPRPDENQTVVYNGHKRVHGLKFQSVVIPNGLIAHLYGPVGELLLCLSDWSSLFFFYFL